MDDFEIAQLKDRILQYLVENDVSNEKDVFEALGKPLKHPRLFQEFTAKMFGQDHKYCFRHERPQSELKDPIFDLYKTAQTKPFLDNGGFVGIYKDTKKELEKKEKVKKAADKQTLNWWLPIAISLISAMVAIVSLIQSSNSVSQSDIELIQYNIDRLKSDYKKENDELKERIYKAELLIAVYESGAGNEN